jgi:hypothetical protein
VTLRQATGCTAIDCGGRTVIPGFFDPYFRLTEAFAPLPEKKREWKSCLLAWLRQVGDLGITTFISPELGRELPEGVLPVLRQLYREEVALPRLLFWQNGAQDPTAIQPMRRWPAFAGRLAEPQVLLQPYPQPGLTAFAVPDGESIGRVLSLLEARPQETGRLQRTALLGAPCTTPEQLRIMGELKLEIVAFPGSLEESLLACTGLPRNLAAIEEVVPPHIICFPSLEKNSDIIRLASSLLEGGPNKIFIGSRFLIFTTHAVVSSPGLFP